jgi:hypothetical protein
VTKSTFILSFIGLSLLAILTFSLSKSWMYLDRGINLSDEENPKEEIIEKDPYSSDDLLRESKVIWKNFIYYPTDLNKEEGSIGPNKILHHARNLTFLNLSNGKIHSIFEKKVYIYDYFPGDLSIPEGDFPHNKNKFNQIDIGNKFIILIMTIDTNKDGYLNYKDKARVLIYDPLDEKLSDILPENYFFESLLMNTKKNILALVVREWGNKKSVTHPSQFFIYDSILDKGILVKSGESANSL